MQPLLWTTPWAFAGLVAIPALLAIYWLRFRYRPQPVSSLLFWRDIPESRDAGIRWQKLQLPLLFFLELLAMLALVGAALGLRVLLPERSRPLIVILDDSLSMQAGRPSARERAERELRDLLRHRRFASVRLLLAGPTPQWLGQAVTNLGELEPMLALWRCRQPSAAIGRALSTAREWGGREALLLVLTDTPPKDPIEAGTLQWWAFGQAHANLAFVHAVRTAGSERDHVVLEIANFSEQAATVTLTLRLAGSVEQVNTITIQPGETQSLHYTVPPQIAVVEAILPEDALEADNQVWLVRHSPPPVHVAIEVGHAKLGPILEKALRAAGKTVFDSSQPDLLITDNPNRRASNQTWLVQLVLEKDGEAFTGPFLLDRRHPLCEGLSLQDVIWGARRELLEGTPLVTVGDVPLISEAVRGGNRRHLRIRLVPELTTWWRSPDWPIFWANLVYWRRSELPGPETAHGRLGEVLRVRAERIGSSSEGADNPSSVQCRLPDGTEERHALQGGWAYIPLQHLGVHEIIAGEQRWPLAVNMVNRAESELRQCRSGRWGEWRDEEILRRDYRDISWGFLLVALAVLAFHGWLVWRTEAKASAVSE